MEEGHQMSLKVKRRAFRGQWRHFSLELAPKEKRTTFLWCRRNLKARKACTLNIPIAANRPPKITYSLPEWWNETAARWLLQRCSTSNAPMCSRNWIRKLRTCKGKMTLKGRWSSSKSNWKRIRSWCRMDQWWLRSKNMRNAKFLMLKIWNYDQ